MGKFQIKYAGNPNLPDGFTHRSVDSNLNIREFCKEFDNIMEALTFYGECYQPLNTEEEIFTMINESLEQEITQQPIKQF